MGIKHAAFKEKSDRGLASEWNADHEIDGDVECEQHQHLEHVIENRVAWPAGPVEGQIIYRIDLHKTYVWNGTQWIDITAEGYASILPNFIWSIIQGTWVLTVSTAYLLNGLITNNTQADGDSVTYQVYLAGGTYTLRIMGTKAPDCGIMDVDIDGNEVASFDWYDAGIVRNSIKSQVGITIPTTGLHLLRIRMDGKHGASSAFRANLQLIVIYKTD